MEHTLAKKFTLPSLLAFAMPNVLMMVCLSLYIIVDGMFVARFLGTTALSAVNMVYPAICLEMAVAIMLATGGSAIIARKLGEGRTEEAQKNLSFLIYAELGVGIAIAVLGNAFTKEIMQFLGASPVQLPLSMAYARIIFTFAPAFFLQTAFQTFFVTAGRPALGLVVTLLAGGANIVLDYLFMKPLQMGIAGAAWATGVGYCIPAVIGLLFFLFAKQNPLRLVKPAFDGRILRQACANGSSEMVTNLANAATTLLFNYTLLQFYGEDGVAAITILLYFQYLFTALYFGYSNGIAPIVSFKYGRGDGAQLQSLFQNSMVFLVLSAVLANALLHGVIRQALTIFTPADSPVYAIALHGFTMYSAAFLLMGLGIFASAFFTAFSDGKSSAIISFSRTFVFIVGAILLLPHLWGEAGIWLAVPVAETLGIIVAIAFLIRKRKRYAYA